MSEPDVTARFPLVPLRAGLVVGATVFGLIALAVTASVSGRAVATVALVVFFAVFFGFFTWSFTRRRQRRLLAGLVHGRRRGHRSCRDAFLRGLLIALALAITETLVVGGFAWLWSPEEVAFILPGILLGFALQVALDLRDLRGWQNRNGLLVFTRPGAAQMALTFRQASEQLVVVSAN